MRQQWRNLLFLHWPVSPAAIQAVLPRGLTVDTFEGDAYIGLVPFRMRGVRPVWSPPIPGLSHFPECNVRTYVHREGSDPGVWFFSLDAGNPIAVAIARTLWKLPYFFAAMQERQTPSGEITYRTRRLYPPPLPAATTVTYRPQGTPAAALPGTQEFFLVERYVLYTQARSRLWRGRVHHSPYPLQSAQLDTLDDTSVAAAGFPLIEKGAVPLPPPLIHYAAGVDVEVFALRPV